MKIAKMAGTALVALALLAGGSRAMAHEEGEGHGEGKGGMMMEKMGLSKENAAKVMDAMKKHRQAMKAMMEKSHDLVEKLEGQVEAKAKDSEISATLDALQAQHKEMEAAQAVHMEAMRGMLTPMQQAKMFLHMRKEMREGGMGMGMHGEKHDKGGKDDKDDDDKDDGHDHDDKK